MKITKFVLVSLSILLLSSCSYRLVDFTVISSKNHNLKFEMSDAKQVEGKSMGFIGLGASIKDAMDEALAQAGPEYDLLINGVVRQEDYFFVAGYKVTGTAVSSKKLQAFLGDEKYKEFCETQNIFNPETSSIKD